MAYDTKAQRRVYDEAIRAVPGMIACKARSDFHGARELAKGVLEVGVDEGFCSNHIWSIMFSAALNWCLQSVTRISTITGREFEDIAAEMALVAAIMENDVV